MNTLILKDAILQTLSEHEQQLADYGVKQIGLFGSYVRNEATDNSDIDLLVDIQRERKTLKNILALNDYLEDLFKTKVDLITLQSLSPYIGPRILQTVVYAAFSA